MIKHWKTSHTRTSRWICAQNDIKDICLIFRCNLKANKTFLFEHYRWPLGDGGIGNSRIQTQTKCTAWYVVLRTKKKQHANFKYECEYASEKQSRAIRSRSNRHDFMHPNHVHFHVFSFSLSINSVEHTLSTSHFFLRLTSQQHLNNCYVTCEIKFDAH